jgi:hypothetical protein
MEVIVEIPYELTSNGPMVWTETKCPNGMGCDVNSMDCYECEYFISDSITKMVLYCGYDIKGFNKERYFWRKNLTSALDYMIMWEKNSPIVCIQHWDMLADYFTHI